jgi:hypothetical protein
MIMKGGKKRVNSYLLNRAFNFNSSEPQNPQKTQKGFLTGLTGFPTASLRRGEIEGLQFRSSQS